MTSAVLISIHAVSPVSIAAMFTLPLRGLSGPSQSQATAWAMTIN